MHRNLVTAVGRLLAGGKLSRWLIAVAVFGTLTPAPGQTSLRLAVVADNPGTMTALDLLTVELSHFNQVTLLERAQINKVLGEQALSTAGGGRDFMKLGKIMGAAGLVILDLVQKDGRSVLSSRLVAVEPGVVLAQADYPFPLADAQVWSRLLGRQFQPLLPKLNILTRDALAISLLDLRSAVRSKETEALEREMNLLLKSRLLSEKEIFVLERQKLEQLAGEKDFRDMADSPFWNGSYLLDGTIDKNGYDLATVTVSARLAPPGKVPVLIEVQGKRTDLPAVINDLARQIFAALKKQSGSPDWKPAEEAEQYFEEGKWALKWGMLNEAQAAADASWALGKKTREVSDLRITIYGAEAETDWPWWAFRYATVSNSAPNPAKLAPAITALDLFDDADHAFFRPQTTPDHAFYEQGLALLNGFSEMLEQYYYFGQNAAQEHKEELTELRSAMRRTAEIIANSAPDGLFIQRTNSIGIRARNESRYDDWFVRVSLAGINGANGSLWYDTPEQCLGMYREVYHSGVSNWMFEYSYVHKIIAWNPEDKKRCEGLWSGFIHELCESTNGMARVAGRYLDAARTTTAQEFKDRAIPLFQVAAENAYAIVTAKQESRIIHDMEVFVRNDVDNSPGAELYQTVNRYYSNEFLGDFNFHSFLGYLQNSDHFDAPTCSRYLAPASGQRKAFSTNEATQLLAAMEDFKRRCAISNSAPDFNAFAADRGLEAVWLNNLLPKDTNVSMASKPPRVVLPNTNFPTIPMRGRFSGIPGDVRDLSTNILRVARFWDVPPGWIIDSYNPDGSEAINLGESRFRDGRFWMEVFNGANGARMHGAALYGIDLLSFDTVVIKLPMDGTIRDFGGRNDEIFATGNSFEVLSNYVYFNGGGKIQRYSLSSKSWEDMPVPGTGGLSRVGGRLFLVSGDSIMEMKENGKGAAVLASARRRPPVNLLDAAGNFANILPGPHGGLRTIIGGTVYDQAPGRNDWSQTAAVAAGNQPLSATILDGGAVLKCGSPDQETEWQLLRDGDISFEKILKESPLPRPFGRRPPTKGLSPVARWNHPWGISLLRASIALDASNVWVFSGNLNLDVHGKGKPALEEQAGHHALLLGYENDLDNPALIPLRFDLKDGTIPNGLLTRYSGLIANPADDDFRSYSPGRIIFNATPDGHVITAEHIPGFWLIPRSEVMERVQTEMEQLRARQDRESAVTAQRWADLMHKFHLDHKDNFTADEKSAMIDDPLFLELELPNIDLNQNGVLDADELQFFDLNKDGILNPKEISGIQQTWKLLAAQVMKDFDRNGDGVLDASELAQAERPVFGSRFVFPPNWAASRQVMRRSAGGADVTLDDLVALQKMLTTSSLAPAGMRLGLRGPQAQTTIEEVIENYWKRRNGAASNGPAVASPVK